MEARITGYREALYAAGISLNPGLVQRIDAGDSPTICRFIEDLRPEAMEHPDLPARDILLDFTLMVRQSCGTAARPSNGV